MDPLESQYDTPPADTETFDIAYFPPEVAWRKKFADVESAGIEEKYQH